VRASGYERFIDTVQVRGGGSATVTARLVRSSDSTARRVPIDDEETQRTDGQPSDRSAPPGWVLPTGIALAAVGVVGIAIGSGLLAVREDRAQQRLTCSDTEPECRNAYGAALDAEGGGVASFLIGGGLLAGGATILVLGMMGALGTGETTDDAEAHVRCMPGALSIACEGRF
jgi:hypothetical protein